MTDFTVQSVEVIDFHMGQNNDQSTGKVRVNFSLVDDPDQVTTWHMSINARFATAVSRFHHEKRLRNLAVQKINKYFAGEDDTDANIFVI